VNLRKADAERIFRKLELKDTRSKKHVHGWLMVDGQRVLPLHYSLGRGDMPGHVPERFRKAMRLDRAEFREMVNCKMTRAAYLRLLRSRGVM
jgi:hypothetical protein